MITIIIITKIVMVIISIVIMKIIVIMVIKIITVIKITITVIMKLTIVLKLMKIVVQSHNPERTYVQILTMSRKKFKKNLSLNIAAPSATQQGY